MSLASLVGLGRPMMLQTGARSLLRMNPNIPRISPMRTPGSLRFFTPSRIAFRTDQPVDIQKQIAPLPYRFHLLDLSDSRKQPALVDRETALLNNVKALLKQLDAPKDDLQLIER